MGDSYSRMLARYERMVWLCVTWLRRPWNVALWWRCIREMRSLDAAMREDAAATASLPKRQTED